MSEPKPDPRAGFYCPECGAQPKLAEHETCGVCGSRAIPFEFLEHQLGDVGLYVVTATEKAVLDAMAVRPCYIVDAESWAVLTAMKRVRIDRVDGRYVVREADWDAPCKAELTRRGPVVPELAGAAELARRGKP